MAAKSVGCSTWSGNLAGVPSFTQGAVEIWSDGDAKIPKRKQDKGYEKWLEGFIHEIQVKDGIDTCSVRALSYRSMAKNERPYKVEVVLLKARELRVETSSCECKAGSAKCSHLVALLYSLAHLKKLGFKAVPPVISKTSKPQQWHVPSRDQGIRPDLANHLTVCKVKPPKRCGPAKKRRRVTEGVLPNLYCPFPAGIPWSDISGALKEALKSSDSVCLIEWLLPDASAETTQSNGFGTVPKGSVVATQQPHVENGDIIFHDAPDFPNMFSGSQETSYQCALPKAQQDVLLSLQFDVHTCAEIEQKTVEQSKTPLWRSVREKRLTASQFHRIVVRRRDHEKLAASLRSVKNIQTKAMKQGIEKEDQAAKSYATVTGYNVYRTGFVINVHAPHLGCSPDRKVYDPTANPPFGLLEIKCPAVDTFQDAQCLKQEAGGIYRLNKKHAYYHQVMGQMALTGSEWCDFFVMCTNDYHLERIHFNAEAWQHMKQKLDTFFFEYYLPLLASV